MLDDVADDICHAGVRRPLYIGVGGESAAAGRAVAELLLREGLKDLCRRSGEGVK